MEWDSLYIEKTDNVAFLTLDRSASLNAVNDQLIGDFEEACQTLCADGELRVVVLKGEGRAFCAGMDLNAAAHRPSTNEAIHAAWAPWQRALDMFEQLNALTIASIHGACLGAGCELVLACDFRIAALTPRRQQIPECERGQGPFVRSCFDSCRSRSCYQVDPSNDRCRARVYLANGGSEVMQVE